MGCGQGGWGKSVKGKDTQDSEGFFQSLLRAGGLFGWEAEQAPDRGEGIEGMVRLVDGAAEQLWEQGVYKAVFQEFKERGGSNILEFQRYYFREARQANRYVQKGCVAEGRKTSLENWRCASVCIRYGEYLTQVLIRWERDVLDVRFYGHDESAVSFIKKLKRGFVQFACKE